jgi:hypothetical protein
MRNQRWAALALGLFVATSAWPITLGGGGDPIPVDFSQTYDLTAAPATAAATYLVENGKAKNVTKVAIASFCVGLVYGKGVSGNSSGGSYSFTQTQTAVFPGGIPTGRLLTVADTMYDQFEADLKAAGFEVVPHEQLAAMPAFQKFAGKMVTDAQLVKENIDLGKGKSAANLVLVTSPKQLPFLKDCRAETPGTLMAKVKLPYEKDLAGITLITVVVTLDFGKPVAGGGFWQGAKADLQYGEYLPSSRTANVVSVFNNGSGATYWLKQSLVPAENPFKEGGTGAVKRSGEYNDLSGESTRTTETEIKVDADHDLWFRNAEALTKSLSAMYVAKLKGQ